MLDDIKKEEKDAKPFSVIGGLVNGISAAMLANIMLKDFVESRYSESFEIYMNDHPDMPKALKAASEYNAFADAFCQVHNGELMKKKEKDDG